MRIRRLKLAGFKSFVDPAELVIEPGLTGVVGPNGCGKSNLLEAIRWVMGEGSPKSLRGGGMEDVIFAGTAERPAREFAEVSMLVERLDEEGRPLEAEVVRRIERGAGSAYRVDGRDVRQKDVALLFADAATGAHSPALVSQGRVAALISAKPAERRAMLEEAAGIAGLHVRRRDAEQKLRATETNLERLQQLIGDMAARAAALKRQARTAERYRLLTAEIRVAEARLIWARWREAADASTAAKREAAAADARVADAAEAQRSAAGRTGEATRAMAAARSAAQCARDTAAGAGHRLAILRTELATAERRLAEIGRLLATLEHDRAREGELAEDAAAAIARLTAEVDTLDARLAEAGELRPAAVARLAETEARLRDAEIALAQALAAEASEQAEARIARAAEAAARQRLDRAETEVARIERDRGALEDAAAARAAGADAVRARTTAEEDAAVAVRAIGEAEVSRTSAAAARDAAQSAAATARADLAALEGEAAALRRSLPERASERAVDRLVVEAGCERALAAALGGDLDAQIGGAAAVRWEGADAVDDPALPAGSAALAHHVEAPAALARRLAQVIVADDDEGRPLAVGQRLVTRAGRMRRWDGFVAEDIGAATAEALVRRNRLTVLDHAIPAGRAMLAEAEAEAARAIAALAATAQAIEQGRARQAAAERRARDAGLAEDRARLAIERIDARALELDERNAIVGEERAAADCEARAAAEAIARLPDGADTARAVAAERGTTGQARALAVQLRADLAGLDRGLAADRDRITAARGEAEGWRARAGDAARRIAEMARRREAAEEERAVLATAPPRLAERIAAAEREAGTAAAMVAATVAAEQEADVALRAAEAMLAAAAEAVAAAREARATAAARHENHEARRIEMGRIAGERFQCPAPVLPERIGFDPADVGEVAEESQRFETLGLDRERLGPVNLVAERELAELEAGSAAQAAERDELVEVVSRLRGSIGSLNREGRVRLRAAFEAVDGHFRRLFARLFGGGEAHLAMIDSDDPLEAGIEIMAQPPGKRLTSLTLLSGGEQALTAVALIFGLFLTNPAPICVLDEVDAPLDDANIERFCDLLDQMARETDTRYLVVTHNAVTMARMHRLFGVTMVERGISRLVSVDLGGAETLLAAE